MRFKSMMAALLMTAAAPVAALAADVEVTHWWTSGGEAAAEEDADLVGRMFQAAVRVAGELRFAKNGYRLVLNNGAGAGQIVPHLHLHVMSGRRFAWPPG